MSFTMLILLCTRERRCVKYIISVELAQPVATASDLLGICDASDVIRKVSL
jgi:hypothetical protein